MISDIADDREGSAVVPDEVKWPLERVLDTVGLIIAGVVLIRGIGGLMAGLGVSSFHVNLGATAGSGIVLNNGFTLPTALRLQYGTSWADMSSGLGLLAAVGLIAIPRMVWAVPRADSWSGLAKWSMVGIGVLAVLTAASGVIGTLNWALNVNRIAGPAEAINIAEGVAVVALAVISALLSWYALPYLVPARVADERAPN